VSRIRERFTTGKQLIPYLMGGWPDETRCEAVFRAFAETGCGIIEIGVPYSDPLADGPTIQRAGEQALAAGVNTDLVLDLIARVTADTDVSPVLMVYYNLIYRYGFKRFAEKARAAGVEGVIVPDLSVEESDDWRRAAVAAGIDTIFLAAPTSSDARLAKIAAGSSGFVYAVSLTGVTGARAELPDHLQDFINRLKARTELPTAVGFGISQPGQAAEVARFADGVIVGSAVIDLIENSPGDQVLERVRDFGAAMLSALRSNARLC
jgi:tryptophan synthase alpha chain